MRSYMHILSNISLMTSTSMHQAFYASSIKKRIFLKKFVKFRNSEKIQLCLKKMDSNLVQKIAGTVQKRYTVRRNDAL